MIHNKKHFNQTNKIKVHILKIVFIVYFVMYKSSFSSYKAPIFLVKNPISSYILKLHSLYFLSNLSKSAWDACPLFSTDNQFGQQTVVTVVRAE